MKAFILTIVELALEAFEGGVSQEAIIRAIKAEMTAIARKEIVEELKEGEAK